jgi:hypothetical protein
MEFCFFIQNENILKFDTKQEHWYKSLIFRREKKRKKEEKESFEKSAKELFQFIRDQEAKKNWNKAKADENKSDFQNPIIMVKILLKV